MWKGEREVVKFFSDFYKLSTWNLLSRAVCRYSKSAQRHGGILKKEQREREREIGRRGNENFTSLMDWTAYSSRWKTFKDHFETKILLQEKRLSENLCYACLKLQKTTHSLRSLLFAHSVSSPSENVFFQWRKWAFKLHHHQEMLTFHANSASDWDELEYQIARETESRAKKNVWMSSVTAKTFVKLCFLSTWCLIQN